LLWQIFWIGSPFISCEFNSSTSVKISFDGLPCSSTDPD